MSDNLVDELRANMRDLERDLARARELSEGLRRRLALLESDRDRAWRIAAWGGARRTEGADHAEG